MPLTKADIERIVRLGYSPEQFMVYSNELWRLKNINGRCVFLGENGLCKIYEHRPLGCRLYPLIEIDGSCEVDLEYCKYAHMVSEREIERFCRYVIALNRLLDRLKTDSDYRELKFLK